MSARVRRICAPALAVLAALVVAAPAQANVSTFANAFLLVHGHAFADSNAHAYIAYVWSTADHSHCDAYSSGYGGDTSTPNSGTHHTYYTLPCQPGTTSGSGPNSSTAYHGAEINTNGATDDSFSWAQVAYNCTWSDGWIC